MKRLFPHFFVVMFQAADQQLLELMADWNIRADAVGQKMGYFLIVLEVFIDSYLIEKGEKKVGSLMGGVVCAGDVVKCLKEEVFLLLPADHACHCPDDPFKGLAIDHWMRFDEFAADEEVKIGIVPHAFTLRPVLQLILKHYLHFPQEIVLQQQIPQYLRIPRMLQQISNDVKNHLAPPGKRLDHQCCKFLSLGQLYLLELSHHLQDEVILFSPRVAHHMLIGVPHERHEHEVVGIVAGVMQKEGNIFLVIFVIDGGIDSIELLLFQLLLPYLPVLPMLLEPLLKLLLTDHLPEVVPHLRSQALLVHIQVYINNSARADKHFNKSDCQLVLFDLVGELAVDVAEGGGAVVSYFVQDLMDCHETDESVIGLWGYPFFGLNKGKGTSQTVIILPSPSLYYLDMVLCFFLSVIKRICDLLVYRTPKASMATASEQIRTALQRIFPLISFFKGRTSFLMTRQFIIMVLELTYPMICERSLRQTGMKLQDLSEISFIILSSIS